VQGDEPQRKAGLGPHDLRGGGALRSPSPVETTTSTRVMSSKSAVSRTVHFVRSRWFQRPMVELIMSLMVSSLPPMASQAARMAAAPLPKSEKCRLARRPYLTSEILMMLQSSM